MSSLKTLKVCLSSELPLLSERKTNIIYFLYDKLIVFIGQSQYYDPYAIVEDIPESPVYNMLYFCINDGKVKVYIDYSIKEIAEIENTDQIELLKQAGTVFFTNSEKRYLDLKRRLITLPYQNGTYELTVSLASNLKIDQDTVIGFNPKTNMFEIIGKYEDFDMVFSKRYRAKDTSSVSTNISDNRISGEVKLHKSYDNMIKVVNDGLFVDGKGKVSNTEFKRFVNFVEEYKQNIDTYIKDLSEKIGDVQTEISTESINQKILDALKDSYPEIEYALSQFDIMSKKFAGMEERSKNYTDKRFDEAFQELSQLIIDATENPWETYGLEENSSDDVSEDTESEAITE